MPPDETLCDSPVAPRATRLNEFARRIVEAPGSSTAREARDLIEVTLTAVENEMSGIQANPDAALGPPDGRMYPPHDHFQIDSGSPGLLAFRQREHVTFIADNGAIRIQQMKTGTMGAILLDKPGADGRLVADFESEATNDERSTAT